MQRTVLIKSLKKERFFSVSIKSVNRMGGFVMVIEMFNMTMLMSSFISLVFWFYAEITSSSTLLPFV